MDKNGRFSRFVCDEMKARYPHFTAGYVFGRSVSPAATVQYLRFAAGTIFADIMADPDDVESCANDAELRQLAAERVRMCTLGLGEPVSVPSLPSEALTAQAA